MYCISYVKFPIMVDLRCNVYRYRFFVIGDNCCVIDGRDVRKPGDQNRGNNWQFLTPDILGVVRINGDGSLFSQNLTENCKETSGSKPPNKVKV